MKRISSLHERIRDIYNNPLNRPITYLNTLYTLFTSLIKNLCNGCKKESLDYTEKFKLVRKLEICIQLY